MPKSPVVAFVQARLTSTRLPNKVLASIGEWTALDLMVRRLARAQTISKIVFVIPNTRENDPLAVYIEEELKRPCFRGDEHDVLLRFVRAADQYPANYYVRLTGDCPLICPEIVDQVVEMTVGSSATYGSNVNPPTFPDGFDVECFSRESLEWSDKNIVDRSWREHVTFGIRESTKRPAEWRFLNLARENESRAWIRLTLDNAKDLEVLIKVAKIFADTLISACANEIENAYIEHNLDQINGMIVRNEGAPPLL